MVVNITSAAPRNGRQAMWEIIRRLGTEADGIFGAPEVRGELPGAPSLDKVRDYLVGLRRAGFLEAFVEDGARPAGRYRLVNDCGIEAPRVRRDGSLVTQGRGQEQLWRTIKVLGEFDCLDLSVSASTEQRPVRMRDAEDYVLHLRKAGYLVKTRDASPTGGRARYRLLPSKYTGPYPPRVQRIKQVFDPNLGRVVYRAQGDGS